MKNTMLLLFLLISYHTVFSQSKNPAAEAKRIANLSINAMGGLKNFNSTNYIGWNFFGHRQLIWDKTNKRVRIDFLKEDLTIITDLESLKGKVFMNGEEIAQPDTLNKYLEKGQSIWRNDSYWLVMPFKLLDPGVNLYYEGIKKTTDSIDAHVLRVTFGKDVGETPQNKYEIFIDTKTYFVTQWIYYKADGMVSPTLINTWGDYKKYGKIYLSSDRGERGKLTDLHVWKTLPASVFTQPGKISFDTL